MISRPILTTTLFISLLLSSSCAVKCYFCGVENGCSNPFDASSASVIDCDESCLRFDGRASDNHRVLVRHCGIFDTDGCEENEVYEQSATGSICHCKTDLCNGASTYSKNISFLILGLLQGVIRLFVY